MPKYPQEGSQLRRRNSQIPRKKYVLAVCHAGCLSDCLRVGTLGELLALAEVRDGQVFFEGEAITVEKDEIAIYDSETGRIRASLTTESYDSAALGWRSYTI